MVDFSMSSWKLSPVDDTIVSPLFLSLVRDYVIIIAPLKTIKLKIPEKLKNIYISGYEFLIM